MKFPDISPRNEEDYYPVMKWLVSKRLAFILAASVGICCLFYIWAMKPMKLFGNAKGYQIYHYNALPLKFYKGNVEIRGKSGYKAYRGEVKKGVAAGRGTLFNRQGEIVYQGQFKNNMYNGKGELNYKGNVRRYKGQFKDNMFEGQGILYRQDAIKEYEGGFKNNWKQGNGELYNTSGQLIFTGSFRRDFIAYEELVGKTTAEISEMYQGKRIVYTRGEELSVAMPEIQALYYGQSGEDTLAGEWNIKGIYVLTDHFAVAGKTIAAINDLNEYFGIPDYEGNTAVQFTDVVAMKQLPLKQSGFKEQVAWETENELEDVIKVRSYDRNYEIYLHTYEKDKFRYTFFSQGKKNGFHFYLIEAVE